MNARVTIPLNFWRDHSDRAPYNEGEPVPVALRVTARGAEIATDDPGLAAILSDAEHYADPESMDECPRYLRESAKRAVAAIKRATV